MSRTTAQFLFKHYTPMATKEWTKLEGSPLIHDVGTSQAAALKAGGQKASTMFVTTDNSIVMNGEIVGQRNTPCLVELGYFDTEDEALNALKEPSVSHDKSIGFIHLTYQTSYSLLCMQSIENDYTRQIIFNKAKTFHRAIYFKADGTLSYAEDWAFLAPDRLAWDSDNHRYLLSQFGNKFGQSYTDPIPLATTSTAGLMSAADKAKLDSLSTSTSTSDATTSKDDVL